MPKEVKKMETEMNKGTLDIKTLWQNDLILDELYERARNHGIHIGDRVRVYALPETTVMTFVCPCLDYSDLSSLVDTGEHMEYGKIGLKSWKFRRENHTQVKHGEPDHTYQHELDEDIARLEHLLEAATILHSSKNLIVMTSASASTEMDDPTILTDFPRENFQYIPPKKCTAGLAYLARIQKAFNIGTVVYAGGQIGRAHV
jgi:hypothetical protein